MQHGGKEEEEEDQHHYSSDSEYYQHKRLLNGHWSRLSNLAHLHARTPTLNINVTFCWHAAAATQLKTTTTRSPRATFVQLAGSSSINEWQVMCGTNAFNEMFGIRV